MMILMGTQASSLWKGQDKHSSTTRELLYTLWCDFVRFLWPLDGASPRSVTTISSHMRTYLPIQFCTWLDRTDVPKQLSFVGKKSTLVLANFDHFRDFSVKSKQNRQIEPSWTTSMRVSCPLGAVDLTAWLTPAFAMQSTHKPALHLHGSDNVHNSNVNMH